jgi:very-short-patch-repair endonuclease
MSEIIRYDIRLKECARENRKNPTPAERKLWFEVLSNRDLTPHKFTRQKPLDHFIADFYCSKLRLVIEVDGDSHDARQEYDEERSRILESLGLRVVRYTNDQIMCDIDSVYQDLKDRIETIA